MDEHPAQNFLCELGHQVGLENLQFNEDGACCLEVSGRFRVQIEWESTHSTLVFLASLGQPPAEKKEAFFRALLEANFLFHGTAGETLCLSPETGEAMLCRALPLATAQAADLLGEFSYFLETADYWSNRIANGETAAEDESSPFSPANGLRA